MKKLFDHDVPESGEILVWFSYPDRWGTTTGLPPVELFDGRDLHGQVTSFVEKLKREGWDWGARSPISYFWSKQEIHQMVMDQREAA